MTRLAPLLLVLVCLGPAWSDEEAAGKGSDPWLVADEMLRRGEADAALAFAESLPGKDTEALPAYVKRRRDDASAPSLLEDPAAKDAEAAEKLGWLRRASELLHAAGRSARARREWRAAIECWERGLALDESRGDRAGVAQALADLATAHYQLTNLPRVLSLNERSAVIFRDLGNKAAVARCLVSNAWSYVHLGDYAKALSSVERSLAISEKLGDRHAVAQTASGIGTIYFFLGDFSKAMFYLQRSLDLMRELGNRAGESAALLAIGRGHASIEEYKEALSFYDQALSLAAAPEERSRILASIAWVHKSLGDLQTALKYHEQALAQRAKGKERYWHAMQLMQVAEIHTELADHETALSYAEQALSIMNELRSRLGRQWALAALARVHKASGECEEAIDALKRAASLARRVRFREGYAWHLKELAQIYIDAGDSARALACAQQALAEVEELLGGLAEGEGTTGRDKFLELYGVGTLAAARLGDSVELVRFLESGRAGALLETLAGGRAARFAQLPPHIDQLRAAARAEESEARRQHTHALDGENLREIQKAAKRLDEAMERRREVAGRVQREAKRVAGVFYPRAAPLEEIQDWMEAGTALVLYGLCLEEALALVVLPTEARVVTLGTVEEVETACAALACETADTNPTAALATLRSLLVDPLFLGDDLKTLLVSPVGALGYVPWGALLSRPVACVPSSTTWVLLREEERQPGAKILALGDPTYGTRPDDRAVALYRGGRLRPLPASREEANAIGDRVLLGKEATETGLAEALRTEKRWRAVHLACHGLVDTERPLLSSLALTPGKDDDGFLSCLDVFGLEIPADLVVLSACETARGRVAKAEGIVGLTRAFMYAGSPRVLCSLWKVDDEATRALMVKFYALWNPKDGSQGIGAAAALRQAQAYVKSHEKWKHPYYWAAWVLWGLPE